MTMHTSKKQSDEKQQLSTKKPWGQIHLYATLENKWHTCWTVPL
jgi:hypothetical protein